MQDLFYSKIILFGEYSVIKGGKGLAIPCEKYFGELKFSTSKIPEHLRLDELCQYLGERALLSDAIDIERLKSDIDKNMFFDSNIPHGHGIGSSGALCAALYSKYALSLIHI